MNKNIENRLVKYLMNAANIEDLEVLTNWLKNEQSKQLFKDYIRTNYAMDFNTSEFGTKNAKKEYLLKIRRDQKRVHAFKTYKVLKYAAAVVMVFGLGFFFQKSSFSTPIDSVPVIVNNTIAPGTNKATLTLEDGSQITLEKGESIQTQSANSNGDEIIYKAGQSNNKEIAYNFLTIPRGGQFFLKLSDGTQVWLNSESQLKYPVSFRDGETRVVELVYGEAYFDVSSSNEHKGAKFKVLNQAQEIEVLGTEFNVKAYKDETNIFTTLIEGKVSISTETTNQILKPKQQASFNISSKTMAIATVDVYSHTSWKEGVFSFRRTSLEQIMKVLSRWYDMDVEFMNPELKKEGFNGVLGKDQNIEDILKIIQSYGIIENYEIINKKIILK